MTQKLLLADDSVTIQRVVELTFSGEDVQVVTVGDGEQAIARIPVEMPDIVLADIGMPKRSGYDVAAFVKGRPDLSHIPVLLLAGAFEPVDEARAQQVHCDGVLVKPFEPQQVISRVKDLIEAGRAAAAAPPVVPAPPIHHPEPRTRTPEPRVESRPPIAPSPAPKPPSPEPSPSRPQPRVASPDSLDDYFERLDAAFASLEQEPGRPVSTQVSGDVIRDDRNVPTVESLLGRSASYDAPRPTSAAPAPVAVSAHEPVWRPEQPSPESSAAGEAPAGGRNLVADLFTALFAVEQGESAPEVPPPPRPQPQAPAVTEGLIDELTRRVMERLAPEAANELVAQIVSEVAERLIREEIARIKSAVGVRL